MGFNSCPPITSSCPLVSIGRALQQGGNLCSEELTALSGTLFLVPGLTFAFKLQPESEVRGPRGERLRLQRSFQMYFQPQIHHFNVT